MEILTSVMFCVSLWLSLVFIVKLVVFTCKLVIDKRAEMGMILPITAAVCWAVFYHLVVNVR